MKNEEIHKQGLLSDFVSRFVFTCQSSLIDDLLKRDIFNYEDVENFYEYRCPECGGNMAEVSEADTDDIEIIWKCENCKHKQEEEPEQEAQEIYEWWLCSNWLISQLRKHGEPILTNDFGEWWGRTCTGQAILLDSVIEEIYDEISK